MARVIEMYKSNEQLLKENMRELKALVSKMKLDTKTEKALIEKLKEEQKWSSL
jgi:hypothetical protein